MSIQTIGAVRNVRSHFSRIVVGHDAFRTHRSSKGRLSPFKIRPAGRGESSFSQFHRPDREGGLAKYLITFELTYRYQGNRTSSRARSRILRRSLDRQEPLFFGSPERFPLFDVYTFNALIAMWILGTCTFCPASKSNKSKYAAA